MEKEVADNREKRTRKQKRIKRDVGEKEGIENGKWNEAKRKERWKKAKMWDGSRKKIIKEEKAINK